MRPRPYITPAYDHPFNVVLFELDPHLQLRWHSKLERYEIWREKHVGMHEDVEFVMRVSGPKGEYVDPGDYILGKLLERDPVHNDLDAIVKAYATEYDESERQVKAGQDASAAEVRATFIDEWGLRLKRMIYGEPNAERIWKLPQLRRRD